MDDNKGAPSQPDKNEEVVETPSSQDPSDKLTPEHPRFKQVIEKLHTAEGENQDLRTRLEALESRIAERRESTDSNEVSYEERQALDKIEKEIERRDFAKKGDIQKELSILKRELEYERLSNKYDGDDGYPKFDSVEVYEYAKRRGIGNLEDAYHLMHREAITQVEAKKLTATPTPPDSERPTGGARDTKIGGVTKDDINNMSDREYEEKREQILQNLKQRAV